MHKADNLPPPCAVVIKFGHLNLLEPSGHLRVCNGTALAFALLSFLLRKFSLSVCWYYNAKGKKKIMPYTVGCSNWHKNWERNS